ncbi:SpoIIE family protein phosphatase [Streptomyces sp. NPDC001212]
MDTFALQADDLLLLHTDGVIEARNSHGACYPLTERIARWPQKSPPELVDNSAGAGPDRDGHVLNGDRCRRCGAGRCGPARLRPGDAEQRWTRATSAGAAHGVCLPREQLVEVMASIRSQSPTMRGPTQDGIGARPIKSPRTTPR